MNYLEIKDGKFVYDGDLDYEKYNKNFVCDNIEVNFEDIVEDGVWKDTLVDISNIPPSIFFMAVVNMYSVGFDLYIPMDMSFEKFSKYLCQNFPDIDDNNSDNYNIPDSIRVFRSLFPKLNSTGTISSKKWNSIGKKEGKIWCHDRRTINTIQAIVVNAVAFLNNTQENLVEIKRIV